jgi:hypothetical protein
MPLTVCRCCGEKMEPEERRQNPNVCLSCERLLEDDSPTVIAGMSRMVESDADELLDEPASQPVTEPKPDNGRAKKHNPSVK